MAIPSSVLAWRIPGTGEPGGLPSMGRTESDTTEQLHFHFSLSCIGEGNGNPLQCSCLENPRDGGAWWAAVSGVAQSQTRLKRLSSSSGSGSDRKESASSAGDRGSIPGWEDSLEKEMATHSSVLAWRIPWTEEAGGPQSMRCKELDTTERLTLEHNIQSNR